MKLRHSLALLVVLAAPASAQSYQFEGQLFSVFSHYQSFFPCDLDGDGVEDLVARLGGLSLGLDVLQEGPTGWDYTIVPGYAASAAIPGVGDLDGDGRDDIAIVEPSGQDAALQIFYGSDGPQLLEQTMVDGYPIGPSGNVVLVDFDADGDLDVAVQEFRELVVYRNDGARSFTRVLADASTVVYRAHCAADLNGDGLDDLVVFQANSLEWRPSLGAAGFDTPRPLLQSALIPAVLNLEGHDVDGDGDDDVVATRTSIGGGDRSSVWFEISQGPQGPQAVLRRNHLATPASDDVVGWVDDIDLDGRQDMVTFSSNDPTIQVVFGSSGGDFDPPAPLAISSRTIGAVAFDVDRDGDLDLVTGALEWFENVSARSERICPGEPNSVGPGATLFAAGSDVVSVDRTTLNVVDLPPGSFGLFFTSLAPTAPVTPFGSVGLLCLGGSIGRFDRPGEIAAADASGTLRLELDLSDVPDAVLGSVAVAAPESRYFQLWYRDTVMGAATSNFSGAARVDFR